MACSCASACVACVLASLSAGFIRSPPSSDILSVLSILTRKGTAEGTPIFRGVYLSRGVGSHCVGSSISIGWVNPLSKPFVRNNWVKGWWKIGYSIDGSVESSTRGWCRNGRRVGGGSTPGDSWRCCKLLSFLAGSNYPAEI